MYTTLRIIVIASTLGGCTGVVSSLAGENPRDPSTPIDPTPPMRERPPGTLGDVCTPEVQPGDSPFRRLGRDEYRNTLADLLRMEVAVPDGLPEDENLNGFPVGLLVSPLHTEIFFNTAEELAAITDLGTLAPCVAAGDRDRACAGEFITEVGTRAYRRPIEDGERERLLAVFDVATEFDRGLRMVLEVLLQSPKLIYQIERGVGPIAPGEIVALTGYERASRLSYFLWGSMPDDTLFEAAASGELDSDSGVATHALRMLEDGRAHAWVQRFHREWLDVDLEGIDKDADAFPTWDAEYAASLTTEFDTFVEAAFFQGTGSFEALIAGDIAGEPMRAGILTQPAFMAKHASINRTSPTQRGAKVRELVLCLDVPPPPEDVDTTLPEPLEGVTQRERLAAHRVDPACAGCHQLIDPIGLGFEHFDAVGSYRELDAGEPVDATGEILATPSSDATFDGATELAGLLARSSDVTRCVSAKWLQYAVGRPATTDDECALAVAQDALAASGGDLRELVVAVTQSDAFLYRRVTEGEM